MEKNTINTESINESTNGLQINAETISGKVVTPAEDSDNSTKQTEEPATEEPATEEPVVEEPVVEEPVVEEPVVEEPTIEEEDTPVREQPDKEDKQALLDKADVLMVQAAQNLAMSQQQTALAQQMIALATGENSGEGNSESSMIPKSAPMMLAASAHETQSLETTPVVGGKSLSNLASASNIVDTDSLPIVQSGAARRILASALKAYIDSVASTSESNPDAVYTIKNNAKTKTLINDLATVVAGNRFLALGKSEEIFVDDINEVKKIGLFIVSSMTANIPNGVSNGRVICFWYGNGGSQILLPYIGNTFYFREYHLTAVNTPTHWTDWYKVVGVAV